MAERMRMRRSTDLFIIILLLHFFPSLSLLFCRAQQPYAGDHQLDCYGANDSSSLGYSCDTAGAPRSCATYLSFRSRPSYQSPLQIAHLLGGDAAGIAAVNGVDYVTSAVPLGELVLVPATCSCVGGRYQHNASYAVKPGDYYFAVANSTYQGLTTCQSLLAQNPYDALSIPIGARLVAPLRCSCPTADQVVGGIRYFLSYLVVPGDDLRSVARRFPFDHLFVLMYSNELTANSSLYPFSTLLVPLGEEPTGRGLSPVPNTAPTPQLLAETGGLLADIDLTIRLSIGLIT